MNALETPRRIIMMVKAGKPVDAVLEELTPLLAKGDIIIDAGNSQFPDTYAAPRSRGQRHPLHGRRRVRRRGGRAARAEHHARR